jgi:hypothetical protein
VAILRTSACHARKHPEFRITYDPAIVPVEGDVRWLVGWLEQSVAQGKRFAPGQTCQIGWIVTEVRQVNDGHLSLWEPDVRVMPVAWTESVSNTLAHLRLQKDVVESVLSVDALSYPSMLQSAIICTRLGQKDGLVMERTEPSGTDSGWFFGCRDEDHGHSDVAELRRVSLYEAAVRYAPPIVPYLSLPAGVLIGVSKGVPAIFQDGDLLEFKSGSYLAARYPG